MDIDERRIEMKVEGRNSINWFLDLTTGDDVSLPFQRVSTDQIVCQFEGMNFFITTANGSFSKPGDGIIFRITPEKNALILKLAQTNQANKK